MISSLSNAKIKNIIKLNSSAKLRREQNVFLTEGLRMFKEALEYGEITEIFVREDVYDKVRSDLDGQNFEIVTEAVYKKISDTVTPQGITCVVRRKESLVTVADNAKVVVLESLQDPGNMGTIVRTAEAAGIDFILCDKNTVDVYNPKVIRSTMGSVFRVPVIYSDDFYKELEKLKADGFTLYATHLKGEKFFNEIDYHGKCGVLIGNEGNGLTERAAELCDKLIKIPMKGKVESLNASVACAIMMYEMVR